MKFEDFIKKGLAKKAQKDVQLAKALVKTAEQDMLFIGSLPIDDVSSRKIISNCYDILRSLLEAEASLNGFKIYSHEAFTYYLMENNNEYASKKFERFRKIRNSINYYGKEISVEESKEIIAEIKELIEKTNLELSKKLEI